VTKVENILSQVRPVLLATPTRWSALVESLPADLLARSPGAGEWSAIECLQHLVDTETVFMARLHHFLAGEDFPGFDPDRQGTRRDAPINPADIASDFAHLRAASLAALAAVQPADLGRRVRHQQLGMVSLDEMIHEWAAHDLNHTIQAERAVMQPFIEGCGPWRSYFTDHDVAAG
jgi:hypothetical protein